MSTSSEARPPESFAERHAWKAFLVLGIILALFGGSDVLEGGSTYASGESATLQRVAGTTWSDLRASSPDGAAMIDQLVRVGGADLLFFGLLLSLISATALRKGERWAWYGMWLLPLWAMLVDLILLGAYKHPGPVPPPIISGPIFVVVAAATLALSRRRYLSAPR